MRSSAPRLIANVRRAESRMAVLVEVVSLERLSLERLPMLASRAKDAHRSAQSEGVRASLQSRTVDGQLGREDGSALPSSPNVIARGLLGTVAVALAQREHPTTVSGSDEMSIAVHAETEDRHVRHAPRQPAPVRAAVERLEDTDVGSYRNTRSRAAPLPSFRRARLRSPEYPADRPTDRSTSRRPARSST